MEIWAYVATEVPFWNRLNSTQRFPGPNCSTFAEIHILQARRDYSIIEPPGSRAVGTDVPDTSEGPTVPLLYSQLTWGMSM